MEPSENNATCSQNYDAGSQNKAETVNKNKNAASLFMKLSQQLKNAKRPQNDTSQK